MRARAIWAPLVGVAGLAILALISASAPASAFATAGGQGNLTMSMVDAATDTVWYNSSAGAFDVNETLTISAGDTLVLDAGIAIRFADNTALRVEGGLVVRGTAQSLVRVSGLPGASMSPPAWFGLVASGASVFTVEHAVFTDAYDLAFGNGSGALLRNVASQGRLFIENASAVLIENLTMTEFAVDPGRPSLWIEGSANVTVRNASLTPGSGWAEDVLEVSNSSSVVIEHLIERVDSFQLRGIDVRGSSGLSVEDWTFTQGPNGGDPNQALELTDSTDVWIEGLVMTHVGEAGIGAIYGTRSNATIANSTFLAGLTQGVWQFPGRLTGVNATRLPVRPESGAEIWEFELTTVLAQWSAGGAVASGSARVENVSWNVTAGVAGGATAWLWLLREVNASGTVSASSSYTANVTCNCTPGSSSFDITDDWGVYVLVLVGDDAPPVAVAQVAVSRTGVGGTLDGTASYDNGQVAAYRWVVLGTVNATGLPCASAVCAVTFYEPGNFTVELTVTDASGNNATRRAVARIVDATPPQVAIVSVDPARPGEDEPFTVVAAAVDNDPAFLPVIEWYIDGARVAGDTLSPSFRVPAIGDHVVRVVVRDDAGNGGEANRTVTVRDSTAPTIALWARPSGLQAPASIELNGSVATDNVGVVSWVWRVVGAGTDYNLTGLSPNATFPAAGSYNVTLTAFDAEGNAASRTFSIEVGAATPPDGFSSLFWVAVLLIAVIGAVAAIALLRRRKPSG